MSTKTRFKEEAKGNSEMAYYYNHKAFITLKCTQTSFNQSKLQTRIISELSIMYVKTFHSSFVKRCFYYPHFMNLVKH